MISRLHQDTIRDAHIIKNLLELFEVLNKRYCVGEVQDLLVNEDGEEDASHQTEYILNSMLAQLIELLRIFIKNNSENIRVTIIYYIPRLVARSHFKLFPV